MMAMKYTEVCRADGCKGTKTNWNRQTYPLTSSQILSLENKKEKRVFLLYFARLFVSLQIMKQRTEEDYYVESKRIRKEVLEMAEVLKECPLRFTITNGITMDVEITKSDLKTVLGKNVRSNKFNAIKNALTRDLRSYLEKAEYLGWRPIAEGKHIESAYFAYYSRELGCKTFLCMRKLEDGNIFKPYAIIDEHTFNASISELQK